MSARSSDGRPAGVVDKVEKQGGAVVIRLVGDVDMHRSPEVRQSLLTAADAQAATVVVDLARVPHMDSSGVATMVEGLQRVKRYQGRLVLVGMQPRVRGLFDLTRLTDLFEIKENVAEVLGHGG